MEEMGVIAILSLLSFVTIGFANLLYKMLNRVQP